MRELFDTERNNTIVELKNGEPIPDDHFAIALIGEVASDEVLESTAELTSLRLSCGRND